MEAKPIFAHEQFYGFRMVFIILISSALMIGDNRAHYLSRARLELATFVEPVQKLLNSPGKAALSVSQAFQTRVKLLLENESLIRELLYSKGQVQQMTTLMDENKQLRALLKAPLRSSDNYVMGDVIQFDPDPFNHLLVLNRGARNGIHVGQTVIDVAGVMGKVVEVNRDTCRIMLITDPSHALPIENTRNGLRSILAGTGRIDRLELQHVQATMDIRAGDELITSGLGGGYPAGYPVGIVKEIVHTSGASFTTVWVAPRAHLEQSRYLLLVEPTSPASKEGAL